MYDSVYKFIFLTALILVGKLLVVVKRCLCLVQLWKVLKSGVFGESRIMLLLGAICCVVVTVLLSAVSCVICGVSLGVTVSAVVTCVFVVLKYRTWRGGVGVTVVVKLD